MLIDFCQTDGYDGSKCYIKSKRGVLDIYIAKEISMNPLNK